MVFMERFGSMILYTTPSKEAWVAVDKITELVDNRADELWHLTAEVTRHMIAEYVQEAIDNANMEKMFSWKDIEV